VTVDTHSCVKKQTTAGVEIKKNWWRLSIGAPQKPFEKEEKDWIARKGLKRKRYILIRGGKNDS